MTKKTAISLPDDLYREIERARKRAKKDRSSWIQEAASEYLKRRSKEEMIEAYYEAYRRIPEGDDQAVIDAEQAALEDFPYADEDWEAEWQEWEASHAKSDRAR